MFNQLDDNIVDFKIGKFGFLVKRRTLVKTLILILTSILTYFCLDYYYFEPAKYLLDVEPNLDLKWENFVEKCGR